MPTHSQTTGWPCALSGAVKCGRATVLNPLVLNILQILQFFTIPHTCSHLHVPSTTASCLCTNYAAKPAAPHTPLNAHIHICFHTHM